MSKTEYGLIGGFGTLILLLLALWGATRRHRWRSVRLGVFLERERFDDDTADDDERDTDSPNQRAKGEPDGTDEK